MGVYLLINYAPYLAAAATNILRKLRKTLEKF